MEELEKCRKKIEKCDKLIESGKHSAGFGSNLCDMVYDSIGFVLSPLTPFGMAFDCLDTAKEKDSKLAKSVYYTGAAAAGLVGAVVIAPWTLIMGSVEISVAGMQTARDFRNKKRLNKLIEKKQMLEEQMKEFESGIN